MEFRRHLDRTPRHVVSMPFIYGMIIPLLFLDFCIEIYHHLCFPLYGIPLLDRSRYIRLDRHRLSYLKWWEKLNCDYCAYANGLLFYASVIAGETEKYWCSIKHENKAGYIAPPHHARFLSYGDEQEWQAFISGHEPVRKAKHIHKK